MRTQRERERGRGNEGARVRERQRGGLEAPAGLLPLARPRRVVVPPDLTAAAATMPTTKTTVVEKERRGFPATSTAWAPLRLKRNKAFMGRVTQNF